MKKISPAPFRRRMVASAALLCALLCVAAPAYAMDDIFTAQQEAVENPGGGTKVVTPIKDCIDKLPPEEQEAVRRNYLKPYQDCMTRLRALEARGGLKPAASTDGDADKESGTEKNGGKKEVNKPAENPRNFVRVRPDDGPRLPAQSYGQEAPAAPETPSAPAWGGLYNR